MAKKKKYKIINWSKHCGYCMYENNWWHFFYFICHPFKCWEEDSGCYPSLIRNINEKYFMFLDRFPLTKPGRFVSRCLTFWIDDTKALSSNSVFEVRTRGKETIYYRATSHLGHVKFTATKYMYKGKTLNTFMDFTVAGLLKDKKAKTKAKQTKVETEVLLDTWVFTKKKAMKICKEYIENNKIYGNTYFCENDHYINYVVKLLEFFNTSKLDKLVEYCLGGDRFEKEYKKSKNDLEKLKWLLASLILLPYIPTWMHQDLCLAFQYLSGMISSKKNKSEFESGKELFVNKMNDIITKGKNILPKYLV